jgi:hypothetical protein
MLYDTFHVQTFISERTKKFTQDLTFQHTTSIAKEINTRVLSIKMIADALNPKNRATLDVQMEEILQRKQELSVFNALYYIDEKDMETALAMPSNITLKRAIHEDKMTNSRAHGILYMLESKIRSTKYHSTGLLGYKSYTLEHLMPKNWRNKWGNAPDEDVRDHKVLTIGNLAIITTSLNSSIRDAEWIKKLEGKGERQGLKTYAKGLETMDFVLSCDEWNEEKISDRADWIADKIIECWPSYAIDGEEISDEEDKGITNETTNSTNITKKKKKNVNSDRTLFSLNGSEYMSKSKFVRLVIREYINKYPDVNFLELKRIFNTELLESGYRHKGLLCPVEVWNEWINENKSRRYYVSGEDSTFESADGYKFYVNTQWTLKSVKKIVEIAEREGFIVTSYLPE